MPELGKRDELSLTHLSLGLPHESALVGSEDVIGMGRTFRFDEHDMSIPSRLQSEEPGVASHDGRTVPAEHEHDFVDGIVIHPEPVPVRRYGGRLDLRPGYPVP